jgi:endonuclease/exonuclease/phosphatase family metal-dependent hydrolase
MLLGCTLLVLLIFINIFTNVWGYVEPISTVFRNMYWLPYLLITVLITLCVWMVRKDEVKTAQVIGKPAWGYAILLGLVFMGTGIGVLQTSRAIHSPGQEASLTVMTYNIQAANDDTGERSYERQLALIQQVSPDILALQESDTARISLNNNDYVLHYASKLGYYAYYGPTTVTGTFGTAILSKYPLSNTRTVFTFSDQDEIGTAEVEIDVNGRRITIYNVHPDGSDTAMLTWAKTLLERSQDDLYVIALGDFNLRDYEEAYQVIDDVYLNAWVSEFPDEVGSDGTDMSGENRIDHIFVSLTLGVRDPVYVLPPDSATDHPVHWAEITWGE